MSSGPPQLPPKKPNSKGSSRPQDDDDEDNEGSYSFVNEPDAKSKEPKKTTDDDDFKGAFDDDFDDGLDDRPKKKKSEIEAEVGPAIHAGDVRTKKPSVVPVYIGAAVVAAMLFFGILFLFVVMWPRPDPVPVPGGGATIPANPFTTNNGPVGSGGIGPKISPSK